MTSLQEPQHVQVAELRGRFLEVLCEDAPEATQELFETDGSLEAVEAWAERWRLRADWLLDHALHKLEQRTTYGVTASLWPEVFKSGYGATFYLPPPRELVFQWNPSYPRGVVKKKWHDAEHVVVADTREAGVFWKLPARARRLEVVVGGRSRRLAERDLGEVVREYLNKVEDDYRAAGFGRPIAYRGRRDGLPLDLRLRALVWRCCGLPGRDRPSSRPPSWNELALALSRYTGGRVPRSTVERGLKRLAARIDVPLP